jgi:hypothetical protein
MGFLDRLLGRNKESTPEADPRMGDEPRTDPVEPSLDQAEGQVSEARDDVVGTENRIPPGTS